MGITLYYFDVRGLGEPIRMVLSYGKEKFEEVRVPLTSIPICLPPEVKSKCTWGQVPAVEINGKRLAQSLAITRYFAKKYSLVPKDDYEAALCDEYVDSCRDFLNLWVPLIMIKDEAEKKKKTEETYATGKERFLSVFNSIIQANDGKHLVGKSVTWADIYLAHVTNNVELIHFLPVLEEFPSIKSMSEEVFSQPGIKEWMEKRPKTQF